MNLLIQFNEEDLLKRALTFKSYQQEYNGRNKDNQIAENNETLIDFGQEILNFLYSEFLVFRGYPKNEDKNFKSYGEILVSKQTIMNDSELVKISKFLNLELRLSTNPQNNQKQLDNPKFHGQAIKALVAAQYFDKQKDMNRMRKLLCPLYEELFKGVRFVKLEQPINCKGLFQEHVQSIRNKYEISVKLIQDENEQLFENKQYYKMTLLINDLIPIEREGAIKKDVERQLYKDGLVVLKDPQFLKFLQDRFPKNNVESSFQSMLDKTYDGESLIPFDQPGPSGMMQSQIQSSSIIPQGANGVIGDIKQELKIKQLVSSILLQYQ